MKKLVVLSLGVLLPALAPARGWINHHKVSYGFSIGMQMSRMYAGPAALGLTSVTTVSGSGFTLGLLASVPVTRRLSITARPALSFNDSKLGFVNTENKEVRYNMPPTGELALHAIYSLPKGRTRPYLLLGPAYKLPLVDAAAGVSQFSRPLLAIDAGIGLNHAFSRFRLSPELRYSYNVNSISSVAGISNVRMHVLSLSVSFMN